MKKLFSLAMVMIMALALCVPAFATGTNSGSITVNNATPGKTYNIYRIFDMTMGSGNEDNVAYTIANKWTGFFADGALGAKYIVANKGELTNQIVVGGVTKYINIKTADDVASFASDALDYLLSNSVENDRSAVAPAAEAEQTTSTVEFDNLALGYYLIYPEDATKVLSGNASICSLTSTVPDATVIPKATYPSIGKTVDDTTVEYGQEVTYTIKGVVPDTSTYNSYVYTVKDTMSGLTLNGTYDVTIDGTSIKDSSNITGTVPVANADTFEMSIDVTKYQDEIGKEIVITYNAVVDSDAVIGTDGNPNEATLTYGHDPDKTTTTTPIEVKVYTCKIVIDKVDGADNSKKLSDAKFVLYKNVVEGETTTPYYFKLTNDVVTWVTNISEASPVVTDANGAANFSGIQAGTYFLKETEAPDGYNLLTEDKEVSVATPDAEAGVSVTVENNTGVQLPSTGGMGTTWAAS